MKTAKQSARLGMKVKSQVKSGSDAGLGELCKHDKDCRSGLECYYPNGHGHKATGICVRSE